MVNTAYICIGIIIRQNKKIQINGSIEIKVKVNNIYDKYRQ